MRRPFPPRYTIALSLALAFASLAHAQETAFQSGIQDEANLFSTDARTKVLQYLRSLEKKTGVPIVIQTIRTTEGKAINEVALDHAQASDSKGVYLLIAQKEREISRPLVHKEHADRFPEQARTQIRQALAEHFATGDFDDGLSAAASQIALALGVIKDVNPNPLFRNVGTSIAAHPKRRRSSSPSRAPSSPLRAPRRRPRKWA